MWRCRSASASFIASIDRCTESTWSTGSSPMPSASSMPSAISAAMPWPFGGSSCTTAPAKGCASVPHQSVACAARSSSVSTPPQACACAAMRRASSPR